MATARAGSVITTVDREVTGPAPDSGGSGSKSGGTVRSVAMSVPSALLAVAGSPITGKGTLALTLPVRAANTMFAGPSTGADAAPAFRALVDADIPAAITRDTELVAYAQPLDSDLTAIAALTTTAFGRGLLTETNAGTLRTTLGVDPAGSGVTSITGTANQVVASASTGAVTLSLPQSIHTAATPQFTRLGLGGSPDIVAIFSQTPSLQAITTGGTIELSVLNYSTVSSSQGGVLFCRSNSATAGVHAAVSAEDRIGGIFWGCSDGSAFQQVGQMRAVVDGAPSGSNIPGRIEWLLNNGSGFAIRAKLTSTQFEVVGGALLTGAPSGGTAAAFKVGVAASVSPTAPNRTVEMEIGGTTYYLHAKTTND